MPINAWDEPVDGAWTPKESAPSDVKKLIERLRARAVKEAKRRNAAYDLEGCDNTPESVDPLSCEAADALARLSRAADGPAPAVSEAEVDLETALGDLLTWFPDKPSEPEWRLKAGEYGADDAIKVAQAALEAAQRARK